MSDSGGGLEVGLVAGGDPKKVAALERLPIDSLWVGGHVASSNPSPEAMIGLARLAAATERVRIGTSILLLPLYPPALVAKQVADLDQASGGRVVLGIGVGGEYPQEFRACQIPIEERRRRADEAIPLIKRLWSAQPVSHEGSFYAMREVRIHPAPVQPGGPPVIVAGRKDAAMRRAASLGDGWMPYMYSPRRYAASVEQIRQLANEQLRDLTGFGWYAFIFVNVNRDGEVAHEHAARTIGGRYDQDVREMIGSVAAVGSPDEVTENLKAFVDAGARHLIFAPVTATDEAGAVVERLFEEVVPEVRQYADRLARGPGI